MKIRPLKPYLDVQLNKLVTVKDEFVVTRERGKELYEKGFVEILEIYRW